MSFFLSFLVDPCISQNCEIFANLLYILHMYNIKASGSTKFSSKRGLNSLANGRTIKQLSW